MPRILTEENFTHFIDGLLEQPRTEPYSVYEFEAMVKRCFEEVDEVHLNFDHPPKGVGELPNNKIVFITTTRTKPRIKLKVKEDK